MKLKMLEAPLRDFERIGKFDKSHGFRDTRDRKMIQSDKYKDIVYKKFKNVGPDISFFFVNTPKANKYTEIGMVDSQWVRNNLGDEVADVVDEKHDDDLISVIFTNNKGAARVPMTPWIIAHRIGHALARFNASGQGRQFQGYSELVEGVNRETFDILEEVYGYKGGGMDTLKYPKNRSDQLIFRNFWYAIGTFKSARDRNLREFFEVYNELIAQYMITGKIKLNDLPSSFKHGGSFGRGVVSVKDKDAYEELKNLDSMAYTAELHCEWLLNEAQGSILVM